MRILKYYPLWKINELEDFLSKSEINGWRLSCIKFSYFFYFDKCKSKDTEYIITYNLLTLTVFIYRLLDMLNKLKYVKQINFTFFFYLLIRRNSNILNYLKYISKVT